MSDMSRNNRVFDKGINDMNRDMKIYGDFCCCAHLNKKDEKKKTNKNDR